MSKRLSNSHSSTKSILSDTGPSQILPFLYVGCQEDANSTKTLQDIHITHVINVSKTGERAGFLKENDTEHFLRIPIDDCLNAQLLPYLDQAYSFIEKARVNHGRVFIHCLAGISRSPALAIAYVMRYLHLSVDDAYRHVKQRRVQISPNFNFLGQLSEYECNQLLSSSSASITTPVVKCVAMETPMIERCRLVQVEGRSNVDNIPESKSQNLQRPNTLFSSSGQDSIKPKLARPNNISLNPPMSRLINSSYEHLSDTKSFETIPKNADMPSMGGQTDLIDKFFQESTTSKSLEQWTSAQSQTSNINKSQSNVLTSSRELIL